MNKNYREFNTKKVCVRCWGEKPYSKNNVRKYCLSCKRIVELEQGRKNRLNSYKRHREKVIQSVKNYYQLNRQQILDYKKQYYRRKCLEKYERQGLLHSPVLNNREKQTA